MGYIQSTQGEVVGRQDAIDGEVDLELGQLHDEVLFEEEAFQLGLASLDAGVRHQHTGRGLSSGEARESQSSSSLCHEHEKRHARRSEDVRNIWRRARAFCTP